MKSILVHHTLLVISLTGWIYAQESEPKQLLINPDFSMPIVDGLPPGWTKAISASSQENLEMGIEHDEPPNPWQTGERNL